SAEPPQPRLEVREALAQTDGAWKEWAGHSKYHGPYKEAVNQSLVLLKGMIYAPTGGIVAAPTTSLPEAIGGVRNWDYRYCWVRDAALTLLALLQAQHIDEAAAWQKWLLRSVAGDPNDLQIMYSVAGARRLTEYE